MPRALEDPLGKVLPPQRNLADEATPRLHDLPEGWGVPAPGHPREDTDRLGNGRLEVGLELADAGLG